jgi:hypothetical protein
MHPETPTPTTPATRRLVRHYAEMVAAMFLGMLVLAPPAGWLLGAVGSSWSSLSPAMMLFAMSVTMAVPMAAWMRYRGHAWQPTGEMTGAMLLPAFAIMALLAAGAVHDSAALTVLEHVAMLAAMLAAMLLRRDEYSAARTARAAVRPAPAA